MTRINPVLRITPRRAAPSVVENIGISGSNGSFSFQTVTFGNSNGVSFYTTNGSVVASVVAGGGGGIGIAAGTRTATTANTLLFDNANGVTFGLNAVGGSIMTASHNAITTARASTDGLGLNTAGTNITWTANSAGLSINAGGYAGTGFTSTTTAGVDIKGTNNTAGLSVAIPAFLTTAQPVGAYLTTARASNDAVGLATALTAGPLTWTVNSAGISLNAENAAGTTSAFAGNLISGSMTHNTAGLNLSLDHPAWLTTAMQSNAVTLSNIRVSGGTTSNLLSALTFADSNGISFGLNAGTMTATVKTDYLTTAALSNHSHGASANNGSFAFQTLSFSNANGISFGTSAGSAITGSHNAITTARASNDAVGLNTAKTNVTWTVNSSGLSLDAGGYAGTGTSATNASITMDTNGLAISVAAPGAGGGVGVEAGTRTATTAGTLRWETGNGITFGLNAAGGSVMTASHNAITTGRASTDALGLNTAATNVTWTANSAGVSINAAGYGGTTTAITGNAVITLNSLGLRFDGVGLAGTGTSKTGNAAITLNSNGIAFNGASLAGTTTGFAGANISGSMTHNTDGLNLSLSVAAPGAAAENNWINLLGGNTAGNTTVSGSTLGISGINLTLSGTNNSAFNISAPATSSLVGTNGISISTNGSTISIAREVQSNYWNVPGYNLFTGTVRPLASTYVVFPFSVGDNVSFDYLRFMNTINIASTSFASTANTTFSYNQNVTFNILLYSQNTGASSLSLASISSTSAGLTQSANVAYGSASNTQQLNTYAVTYPISTGTSSFSSSYSTSNISIIAVSTGNYSRFTGLKFLDIPFAGSLTPGMYWMALNASTAFTTQATNLSGIRIVFSTAGITQINNPMGLFGQVNNASIQVMNGIGSFTTAGGVTTASLGFSNVSSYGSHIVPIFSLSRTIN